MSKVKINDIILKFLLEVFFNVPFGSSFSISNNLTGLINIFHDFHPCFPFFNTNNAGPVPPPFSSSSLILCRTAHTSPYLALLCLALPCLTLLCLALLCLELPCLAVPCLVFIPSSLSFCFSFLVFLFSSLPFLWVFRLGLLSGSFVFVFGPSLLSVSFVWVFLSGSFV